MNGKSGEFSHRTVDEACFCDKPKRIDLAELYKHAYAELTLQQTKRDQIIHIYMLLFSLLVPLLFSLNNITTVQKGFILLGTTLIGVLLSIIVVRYRVYKEAYWITCTTIVQLGNLKEEAMTKENIQAIFYHCMNKKWAKYVRTGKDGRKAFRRWELFRANLFSAESLYYIIISLLTSLVGGLSAFLILTRWAPLLSIAAGAGVCLLLFVLLLLFHFRNLQRVCRVLVDGRKESFNFTFSKAWFLHFYRI